MRVCRYLRCLVAIVVTQAALTAAAADLTVIDLRKRTAEEVLPVLRPLVGPEVALSGIDYKLLVRGDAGEVARIREVLAVLDRAPRQLLVSVRYTGGPQGSSSAVGVRGTTNNNGSQVVVRGGVTTSTASDSSISSVRVLEGNGAHIVTGQSVPIVSAVLLPYRSHSNRQPSAAGVVGAAGVAGVATDYRELTSGFDVLPRVNGDRVTLDISTQQERAINSDQGAATVQRSSTTVAGNIGEWIELGGVSSSLSSQSTNIGISGGAHHLETQSDQRTVAVKVEQIN